MQLLGGATMEDPLVSSPFVGRWAGNVYGTNTGRVLIDLAEEEGELRGTIRINDTVSGLAMFSCSGEVAEELDLELVPLSAQPGVEIAAGRVHGNLRSDGSISGEWDTVAGTAGTFHVFPHTALMSSGSGGPLPAVTGAAEGSQGHASGSSVEEPLPVKIRLKKPTISCSLDKADLRRLAEILQQRANAARDLELAEFRPERLPPDKLERQRAVLSESFVLKFTINGSDGPELFGTIREVFDSPNYPEEVASVFVASDNTLRAVHNYYPRNAFRLFLYFTKPAVFDFRIFPGLDTPNASNFEVEGYDATWANGVFREIDAFLGSKPSRLSIVHRHTIYDLVLYPVGIPFAFWLCHRATSIVQQLVPESGFLQNSLYVYLFAAAIILFRILFHYVRWVFPVVEYRIRH
jgi:hypothetical protein